MKAVYTLITLSFLLKDVTFSPHRHSRGRVNGVFMLTDDTLEYEGLLATFAPLTEPPFQVWLVAFGVVMALVVCAGMYLVITGALNRKR